MLQKLEDTRLDEVLAVIKEQQIRFPVATIAKELGFSKSQVSSTLNKKTPVSDAFYNDFMKRYTRSLRYSNNRKIFAVA